MAAWRSSRAGADDDSILSPDELARTGYALFGGELYRFALSRLSDDAAAQDAVQETIVRAWRAADRFDPAKASLRTWLYAILRNVIIDRVASRHRSSTLAVMAADNEGSAIVDDSSESVANTDLVTRALGLISHDHRTAIVETYLRDRPYDEVAAELGVSASTLRSRVYHGLRQLNFAMKMMEAEG